eukprot:8875619-Heterocapsa_arctica.AAC.1
MKVLLWGCIKADVLFHLMPVRRPLLSVGLLRRENLQVDFGQACCMKKEEKRIPLVAAGASFYLPVLIEDGLRSDAMQFTLQQAHDVIDEHMFAMEESVVNRSQCEVASTPRVLCHLVEWCCERDSDLTRWVIRHGGGATRLCLPHRDMRLDQQVEQVIRDVRTLANQGICVLAWASLPCTPSCSWQRINQVNERTAQRLKESRRESELMMENIR